MPLFDEKMMNLLNLLLVGCGETLKLFALTLLFSMPLGLVVAGLRMAKFRPLRFVAELYILLLRGTPLMLQLFFVYFGTSLMIPGFSWDNRMKAAIVALVLNYSAYFAEIYRGGIESVPHGQREAGQVLGFTKAQTFRMIVLPQVFKRILPPLSNEVITLVKDTALVQVIGVGELMRVAKEQAAQKVSVIPYLAAAIFYLAINYAVTALFAGLEKKLSYYK